MNSHEGLLALDLGTTTGFAWHPAAGVIISGTWDLRPKKYEGAGMRLVRLQTSLLEIHKIGATNTGAIKHIVFEAVRRHIGTDAAHVYGGLMGTLQVFCELRQVPHEGVSVGTIKKFWTGSGAAKKDAMVAEARRRGYEPIDDNEADALALLHYKLAGPCDVAHHYLKPSSQLTTCGPTRCAPNAQGKWRSG